MKRTPLTRKTPLKKTRMKRNRRRGDDVELRLEFLQLHSNCSVCHANWKSPLEVHHIVGGAGRKDVVPNLLTLCRDCHSEYHCGKRLTPGMLLTAKRESDPENFDESVICKLLGRVALPERWEPTPLPEWVHQERRRNQRK
jgi:5-methylcytosine-specific restriction endonuclease McrA